MKRLKRVSDLLFVLAAVLLVVAIVKAVVALFAVAALLLLASVAFTIAKRRRAKRVRGT